MSVQVEHPRIAPRVYTHGTISDKEILKLWRAGKDTYDIATLLMVPEFEIERRLHRMKDGL